MNANDTFLLVLGIFWSLVTLYFLATLFPPLTHLHRQWEARLKGTDARLINHPTWLQRLVFVPLCGLMSSSVLVQAFHGNFAKLTGISDGTLCLLMVLFPGLYFTIGIVERRLRRK